MSKEEKERIKCALKANVMKEIAKATLGGRPGRILLCSILSTTSDNNIPSDTTTIQTMTGVKRSSLQAAISKLVGPTTVSIDAILSNKIIKIKNHFLTVQGNKNIFKIIAWTME